MGVTTKEKMIDGIAVKVQTLPAMRGLKVSRRVASIILPALTKASGVSGNLSATKLEDLGDAVSAFFDRFSDADLEYLRDEMLATAWLNGREALREFDLLLAGQVITIFKILAFAFEVHFGNFSDAVPALARAWKGAASGSTSPTISETPGPPGV